MHIVVLPQGAYFDVDEVVTALNSSLAGAGFGGVITASDTDNDSWIELTVVSTNPSPLGFSLETGSIDTISGNPLALVGKTAAELSADPDAAFLLVVTSATTGIQVSRLVQVNVTAFSDNNGTPEETSDDKTTLEDVRSALDSTVSIAFGGTGIGIAAGIDGVNITLTSSGNRLEITRQFTLDTLEQITLAELQAPGQVFDVDPDPDAAFEVNLKLKALPGLKKQDESAYLPEGTIKVDLNPFAANAVKGAVVDVDPPTGQAIIVADYLLTDSADKPLKGGESDLQTMLDFNVVSVADILGTFTQIGTWFDRVAASSLLQGFTIPFAGATLGNLLNLKDLIADSFLIDDRDDGPTKSGVEVDIEKLLKWVGPAGKENLVAMFGNAQQLASRLDTLLPVAVTGRVIVDGEGRQNLTYNVGVAGVTLDVDPQTAGEQPLIVPLDFKLDLGPVANFQTDGKLAITATGDVGFTLGIVLGNAVDVLDDDTLLATLNSDAGVKLNTNLALTTFGDVAPPGRAPERQCGVHRHAYHGYDPDDLYGHFAQGSHRQQPLAQ